MGYKNLQHVSSSTSFRGKFWVDVLRKNARTQKQTICVDFLVKQEGTINM